jgi:hypothetical protein
VILKTWRTDSVVEDATGREEGGTQLLNKVKLKMADDLRDLDEAAGFN